jgi:cytosine deaminase
LGFALEAVTEAPARAWRLDDYGIRPGARADFQLFAAPSWEEALRVQEPPLEVWFKGRKVAENRLERRLL